MKNIKELVKKLDMSIVIFPFILVFLFSLFFVLFEKTSNDIMSMLRPIFSDKLAIVYLVINLVVFVLAFYLSFSKYGNIVLGDKNDKPKFSFFEWGAMMFCCGISGDTLYYVFVEWIHYTQNSHIISMSGSVYDNANCYSLFFWSNYWFYLVLAVCFAFMMYVKKVNRQKYSEMLRPVLKKQSDGVIGKIIDVFSVFVIIAAVTCSLSFGAPIITSCLNALFNIPYSNMTTVVVLIVICIIYSISVTNGLKGINFLSSICVYIFFILIGYVLIFGGKTQFIFETSFKQIGLLLNRLPILFTDIDPLRNDTFAIDYSAFYDAYWLTWAITVPYFIAVISKGMKVKQVILGGLLFGIPGGLLAFLVVPNFCMGKQILNEFDFITLYNETHDLYKVMVATIMQLPFYIIPLVILIVSMVCFCATSFDSISLTCSYYSYKNISNDETPDKKVRLYFAILLMILPVVFTITNISYENLQNLAVMAGFPATIIVVLVIVSFFKEANKIFDK